MTPTVVCSSPRVLRLCGERRGPESGCGRRVPKPTFRPYHHPGRAGSRAAGAVRPARVGPVGGLFGGAGAGLLVPSAQGLAEEPLLCGPENRPGDEEVRGQHSGRHPSVGGRPEEAGVPARCRQADRGAGGHRAARHWTASRSPVPEPGTTTSSGTAGTANRAGSARAAPTSTPRWPPRRSAGTTCGSPMP